MPTCPNCQAYVPLGARECPQCGLRTDFDELARAERAKRDTVLRDQELRAAEREAAIQRVHVTTLQSLPGRTIDAELGLIGAEIVEHAIGLDFAALVETKLDQMRKSVVRRLQEKAFALGGDAVVGTSFTFDTVYFGTPGVLWLTVSATGTTVKLVPERINTGANR